MGLIERHWANNDKGAREKWWLHLRARPKLYHAIGRGHNFEKHPKNWNPSIPPLKRVITFERAATKYPCFTIVPNTYIYSDSLCIVASGSFALFATLTSDTHSIWAWKHGTRMKKDLRYTHGEIFETFPFIEGVLENELTNDVLELSQIGELFFNERQNYMIDHNKGMTKFYNDFHDPDVSSDQLESLRKIQSQLNYLVLDKYGWDDIDLDIGFHEVSYLPNVKYIRYTMSEEARLEVLYRLSMLNKERHDLETQKPVMPKQAPVKKQRKKPIPPTIQNDLFTKSKQTETSTKISNQWGDTTDDQILAWLEANSGWHPKQKILIACQANPNEWDKAIRELLAEEYIEKKNTGEAALYRAVP